MSDGDELMTVEQVADYLQVPVPTLYRWMSRRESPPYYKVGRHARFKRSDVMAWLDQRLVE